MSTSYFFIGLSLGYLKLGKLNEAVQAIRNGTKAMYQDIARTQTSCIMYYEAVVTSDASLKRESKKILNTRLGKKENESADFAIAKFLLGKLNQKDLIWQISAISNSILYYRHMVAAQFYIAVKNFEDGDIKGCCQYLQNACNLYNECKSVTMEYEYYLAESWYKELMNTHNTI